MENYEVSYFAFILALNSTAKKKFSQFKNHRDIKLTSRKMLLNFGKNIVNNQIQRQNSWPKLFVDV